MRTILPNQPRLVPPQAKRVFKGIIYDVYQWPQAMHDGSTSTFEMLKRPDTVQIIAVKDRKIAVLEENQVGRGEFIGLPGGRHDQSAETELDAAKRELLEEAGLSFKTWKLLSLFQPQSRIEHFVYTYLATDFEKEVPQHLDSGERATLTWKTFDEVRQLVNDPRVRSLAESVVTRVQTLDELLGLPEYKGE